VEKTVGRIRVFIGSSAGSHERISDVDERRAIMDQMSDLPNLAGDLLRIHRAITRGLTIGIARGMGFIREGFPDQWIKQGYALYIQTLTAVLSAHHQGEDQVAFPALKKKLPSAPFARLSADHVTIEAPLDRIKSTLPDLAGANQAAALIKAVDGLKNIYALWTPHIDIEQTTFSAAALARVMTPDEQAQLSGAFGKHSQEHVGPPFLALPFVLFNLDPIDRAAMSATIPKPVADLIQGEWKEKWAPMKPFLLD
jgi:hypothetical protein